MTADAAHVAAVAEALFARGQVACEFHGGTLYYECASCCGLIDELHRDATVAVETLTPLIRAQERAKAAAEIRAHGCFDLLDGLPCGCTEGSAHIAGVES